jgi:hypothetical protein
VLRVARERLLLEQPQVFTPTQAMTSPLLGMAMDALSITQEVLPAPELTFVLPPGAEENLPVQAAVNRSEVLQAQTVDIVIRDRNGNIEETLRFPVFGRFGRDVNDPGRFTPVPPTAICAMLSPFAAARCMAGGGLR